MMSMLSRFHACSVHAGSDLVEGIPNCQSIYEVARSTGVRTPLIDTIHAVLYEDKSAATALQELLTRAPRSETET